MSSIVVMKMTSMNVTRRRRVTRRLYDNNNNNNCHNVDWRMLLSLFRYNRCCRTNVCLYNDQQRNYFFTSIFYQPPPQMQSQQQLQKQKQKQQLGFITTTTTTCSRRTYHKSITTMNGTQATTINNSSNHNEPTNQYQYQHPLPPPVTLLSKDDDWIIDSITGKIHHRSLSSKQHPMYQIMIGLEIHAQLNTKTKLFSSGLTTNTNTTPNHPFHVHPYDISIPGKLPILSSECVQLGIIASVALQCKLQTVSRFERKHYSYPDLSNGFQITQQRWPLATNGRVVYDLLLPNNQNNSSSNKNNNNNNKRSCRINRIQLEQDTGKTISTKKDALLSLKNLQTNSNSKKMNNIIQQTISFVDFNRANVPLIEIVTEPDIVSSIEAISLVTMIRQLLKHSNVCDGKMEHGQLRVDANINILEIQQNQNSQNTTTQGSQSQQQQPILKKTKRVEIKNLNSIHQIQCAIEYEAKRQATFLYNLTHHQNNTQQQDHDHNEHHIQQQLSRLREETRTWNVANNATELIRYKDGTEDYRFLPDPDLPPIILPPLRNAADTDTRHHHQNENQNQNLQYYYKQLFNGCESLEEFITKYLPELPVDTIQRFIKQYTLSEYQAKVLVASGPDTITFLDNTIATFIRSNHLDGNPKNDSLRETACHTIANMIINDLFGFVNEYVENVLGIDKQDASVIEHSNVSCEQLSDLVTLLLIDQCISKSSAKQILHILFHQQQQTQNENKNDRNETTTKIIPLCPRQIVIDYELQLISDSKELYDICYPIVLEHPDKINEYKNGTKKVQKQIVKVFMGLSLSSNSSNNNNNQNKKNVTNNNSSSSSSNSSNIEPIPKGRSLHAERLQEILIQILDNM